jgi:hypothetical protein
MWWAFSLCSVVVGGGPSRAQSAGGAADAMGDPARVLVVVEDAGNVGLRIADAQSVHEAVITHLRKQLGNDAVIYEGSRKNAAAMKKMLGSSSETQIQDSQLAYYDAAMKAAPWRVKARFGQKKSEHFVLLTCRKVGSDKNVDKNLDKNLDEKRFVGKNFSIAKDAMVKGLAEFCLLLPTTATQIPVEKTPGQAGVIPGLHKKVLKPWSPPPRRE